MKKTEDLSERYLHYRDVLRERYHCKVYKIPIALPVTCPNRDGTAGSGGCTFCGSIGAGYERRDYLSITEQIDRSTASMVRKYKAEEFIPYFLNYTNTYAPPGEFAAWADEALRHEKTVGLDVSTRPDCIHEVYLDILKEASQKYGKDITIELGLQSVNPHTLLRLNRCHTAAECIDAALRIGRYGFELCVHLIIDLPFDDMVDVVEAAKFLSALPVTQVKLHSLFLVKGTELARAYEDGEFQLLSIDDYAERAAVFLSYLRPDIAVQRMAGRAYGPTILTANWGRSWWEVQARVEEKLEDRDIHQGDRCRYLDGASVRHFIKGYEGK